LFAYIAVPKACYIMPLPHAKLKAIALLALERFVNKFSRTKRDNILKNQKIDLSQGLKTEEYIELNKAVSDLNKFNTVNSTPEKEEKTHKG